MQFLNFKEKTTEEKTEVQWKMYCISGNKLTSFLNNQRCHWVTEVKIHFEAHKFLRFCACKDALYKKTQLKQCSWICFLFLQLIFLFFFFWLSHLIPLFLTLLFPLYALKNTDKGGRKGLRANHLCEGDPFTTEKLTYCMEKLSSLYPKCSFYLKITTANFCAIQVYIFSNLSFFFNWSSWNAIIKTSGI